MGDAQTADPGSGCRLADRRITARPTGYGACRRRSRCWRPWNRCTGISALPSSQRLLDSTPAGATPPDLATIYRTVTTLVEQGVLHALTVEGGFTTFGLAENPHHHALCTNCGTVIAVPAQRLTSAPEHAIEGSSFTLSERAGLTLHGLCRQCQR